MTIEFVQMMLDDDRLDNIEKIDILDDFTDKVHSYISSNILHSSQLKELSKLLNFIDENKKRLSDESR